MRYQPLKPLNLGQQLANIRRDYPDDVGALRGNVLEWTGTLTPSPMGRDYRVRLVYQLGARPVVRVLQPSLRALAAGRTIPHLYSQEREELCMYLPGRREWSPEKLLTRTVLRWSVLWLYFFEDWLGSEEWHGGGEHPRPARGVSQRQSGPRTIGR